MAQKTDTKEKPLEKMTANELREAAKEIPEITGVHGMNKSELVSSIKKARGIEEKAKKTSGTVRVIKKKIKGLLVQKEEALKANDKKMTQILKKKISRMKKKTRRVA
jgi:hypothetical protein